MTQKVHQYEYKNRRSGVLNWLSEPYNGELDTFVYNLNRLRASKVGNKNDD